MKIKEVNTLSEAEEENILFTSTMDSMNLMAIYEGIANNWVLDNGASFHVTPNCEWLTKNDVGQRGQV